MPKLVNEGSCGNTRRTFWVLVNKNESVPDTINGIAFIDVMPLY